MSVSVWGCGGAGTPDSLCLKNGKVHCSPFLSPWFLFPVASGHFLSCVHINKAS